MGGGGNQYTEWKFPFIFYLFGGFPLQVSSGLSPLLLTLVDSCKERSQPAENAYSFPLSEAGVETQERAQAVTGGKEITNTEQCRTFEILLFLQGNNC